MSINVDEYLQSLGPPEITIGGQKYIGRFLSLEEWLPFEPRLERIQNKDFENYTKEDQKEIEKLVKDFCDALFPPSFLEILKFWKPTVAEMVLKLPPAAMLKVTQDFFACQARALNAQETTKKKNPNSSRTTREDDE